MFKKFSPAFIILAIAVIFSGVIMFSSQTVHGQPGGGPGGGGPSCQAMELQGINGPCDSNSQCEAGLICEDGAGGVCDGVSFGTCQPPASCNGNGTGNGSLGEGSFCGINSECKPGLYCSGGNGLNVCGNGAGFCEKLVCANPNPSAPTSITAVYTDAKHVRVTIPAPPPANVNGAYFATHHIKIVDAGQDMDLGTALAEEYGIASSSSAISKTYTLNNGGSVLVGVQNNNSCFGNYSTWKTVAVSPFPSASCTGVDFSNATACIGDQNPSVNTAKTLTQTCSPINGGVPWCQFTCNAGFVYTVGRFGASCVAVSGTPETGNICGFAWGATNEGADMGIGWVSFNSKDCDTNGDGTMSASESAANAGCPAAGTVIPKYAVNVDNNKKMTGHAWSSNLGWLKFGNLSSFPSGSGTSDDNAKVEDDKITGWAKFLSADGNGWDGWVSLSGTGYKTTFNGGQTASGQAWGSEVVGWLDFNPKNDSNGVRYCTSPNVTVALTATPNLGLAPLNSVIGVTIGGTATGNSKVEYDCLGDGTYDIALTQNSVSGNNTSQTCNYPAANVYLTKVQVTRQSVSQTGVVQVTATGGPPSGSASCTAKVNGVSVTNVGLNKQVVWSVTDDVLDPPLPAVKTYTWTGNGATPDPGNVSTFTKSYSTSGIKTVHVDVVGQSTASCDGSINVHPDPSFQEF